MKATPATADTTPTPMGAEPEFDPCPDRTVPGPLAENVERRCGYRGEGKEGREKEQPRWPRKQNLAFSVDGTED